MQNVSSRKSRESIPPIHVGEPFSDPLRPADVTWYRTVGDTTKISRRRGGIAKVLQPIGTFFGGHIKVKPSADGEGDANGTTQPTHDGGDGLTVTHGGVETLENRFESENVKGRRTFQSKLLTVLRRKNNMIAVDSQLHVVYRVKTPPGQPYILGTFACNFNPLDRMVQWGHVTLTLLKPAGATFLHCGLWYQRQKEIDMDSSRDQQLAMQLMLKDPHSAAGLTASATFSRHDEVKYKSSANASGNFDKDYTCIQVNMLGDPPDPEGLRGVWVIGFVLNDVCRNKEVTMAYQVKAKLSGHRFKNILETEKLHGI